jgi:hypothetical protein
MAFLVALAASLSWAMWRDKQAEAERERMALESAAHQLQEKAELPRLVDFNRLLLDKHHGITTDQAAKAYRSGLFAMGAGLAILVIAVFAGLRLNDQGDRLFVGSVAAIGAAFTAYLSRTYIQAYERALQQLNQYLNQPVLNSYFLTAERIAGSLPEDRRVEVLTEVVHGVLDSGKEMHRIVTVANSSQTSTLKPSGRRRAAQAEAAVPAQQTP